MVNSKDSPCSIYLIETPKSGLQDLSALEIQSADYNPAFLYEINGFSKRVSRTGYLLVPTTLSRAEREIEFIFNVQSDQRFRLIKCPMLSYSKRKTAEINTSSQHS